MEKQVRTLINYIDRQNKFGDNQIELKLLEYVESNDEAIKKVKTLLNFKTK